MNEGEPRYPGGDALARTVLRHCGGAAQRAFWADLGLMLRTEDGGRVYPVSGQASSVLDALRLAMDVRKVHVAVDEAVEAITPQKQGFDIRTSNQRLWAERVIVTGGGCAQPKLGSDGSAWTLMTALGHRLITPRPALTQITTNVAPIRGLSGIRVKCRISVTENSAILHEEEGEALFTDYGVSGVCAMQCARYVQAGRTLQLNFLHGMGFHDEKQAYAELMRRAEQWPLQPMERLLTGLCVPRLASALCLAAGIEWKNRRIGSLASREAKALAGVLQCFPLQLTGVKGFESAQITAGGIDIRDIEPETMESRIVPGLYAAGEMLDVDGDCGGFNLQFAFGSGLIAGRAAALSIRGGKS